jgi:hypothetical protein
MSVAINGTNGITYNDGSLQASAPVGKNLIINGNLAINQRGVTGTVSLSAGAYGHDRFKAGAAGATYTFATTANVTTITITAGSLQQVVEGLNIQSGTHTLSWTGTAQGKIDAGSYSASGVTGTLTGGTNATVEFNTGTLTNVQLEEGTTATPFEHLQYGQQLALCQRYFERYNGAFDGGIPQGIATVDSANRPEINLFYLEKRANPTISGNTAVIFSTMANTELTTTGGPNSYVGTGPRGANLFYNVASGVTVNTLSGIGYIKLNDATDYINIDAEL